MKSRSICCYAMILMLVLSGCAAPTAQPTATLSPKPTVTQTPLPTLTPEPTETLTPQPTITETNTLQPTRAFVKGCGTVTLGKPGTQSQDKTHPVLVQGVAILCNGFYSLEEGGFVHFEDVPASPVSRLDLDTGIVGIDHADIAYYEIGGSVSSNFLYAINNALDMTWSGVDAPHAPEPTFDECQSQSDLFRTDNPPDYVCMITDAGHVARIKVEQYYSEVIKDQPYDQTAVKISFITWDVLVPTMTPTP